ncbi:UV DNA damage repair endonuclease UvsE [Alkalihalobacterium elongatum]|uniref:UV DNA damage repair endonuclease UvsE n=1 Tax=Alkalihalobacterium elongatum TaxID=2675466 RepID=UPI001C1F726B|nr:UV DNA damage repair endonuclease UvsE [Alkalihalobacterium elongatum]
MRLGYACQNISLKSKMRTCRLATVEKEGMTKIKELALLNFKEVLKIVNWNAENGILFFRLSSDIIPFGSHEVLDWNWWEDEDILDLSSQIVKVKNKYKMRLSIHPGQYTVINSPNKKVVDNALRDLAYHDKLMELVEGTDIIIHTGGAYGNKEDSKQRFINVYNELTPSIKGKLRLENDDKVYNVNDVLHIYKETGVPICFDIHHHFCNPVETDINTIIETVVKTWDGVGKPKMHISSGKTCSTDTAHHDFIHSHDMDYFLSVLNGYDVDIMIEAKMKEKAILQLR